MIVSILVADTVNDIHEGLLGAAMLAEDECYDDSFMCLLDGLACISKLDVLQAIVQGATRDQEVVFCVPGRPGSMLCEEKAEEELSESIGDRLLQCVGNNIILNNDEAESLLVTLIDIADGALNENAVFVTGKRKWLGRQV